MKKLPLYLLTVIALAGCNEKEKEKDDTDATPVPRSAATPVAKATPKSGDWMWKGDGKATPAGPYANPLSGPPKGNAAPADKYANPLSVPNNLLDQKKK